MRSFLCSICNRHTAISLYHLRRLSTIERVSPKRATFSSEFMRVSCSGGFELAGNSAAEAGSKGRVRLLKRILKKSRTVFRHQSLKTAFRSNFFAVFSGSMAKKFDLRPRIFVFCRKTVRPRRGKMKFLSNYSLKTVQKKKLSDRRERRGRDYPKSQNRQSQKTLPVHRANILISCSRRSLRRSFFPACLLLPSFSGVRELCT